MSMPAPIHPAPPQGANRLAPDPPVRRGSDVSVISLPGDDRPEDWERFAFPFLRLAAPLAFMKPRPKRSRRQVGVPYHRIVHILIGVLSVIGWIYVVGISTAVHPALVDTLDAIMMMTIPVQLFFASGVAWNLWHAAVFQDIALIAADVAQKHDHTIISFVQVTGCVLTLVLTLGTTVFHMIRTHVFMRDSGFLDTAGDGNKAFTYMLTLFSMINVGGYLFSISILNLTAVYLGAIASSIAGHWRSQLAEARDVLAGKFSRIGSADVDYDSRSRSRGAAARPPLHGGSPAGPNVASSSSSVQDGDVVVVDRWVIVSRVREDAILIRDLIRRVDSAITGWFDALTLTTATASFLAGVIVVVLGPIWHAIVLGLVLGLSGGLSFFSAGIIGVIADYCDREAIRIIDDVCFLSRSHRDPVSAALSTHHAARSSNSGNTGKDELGRSQLRVTLAPFSADIVQPFVTRLTTSPSGLHVFGHRRVKSTWAIYLFAFYAVVFFIAIHFEMLE